MKALTQVSLRRRLVAAATVVVAAAVVVLVLVLWDGRRSERLSLGAVSEVDERVPRSITVAVLSDTSVRLTFGSDQRPTQTAGTRRLLNYVRKWRSGSLRSMPRPTEVIDAPGLPPITNRQLDVRKGSHVDVELAAPLPDKVCVSTYSSVTDGGAGIFGTTAYSEL